MKSPRTPQPGKRQPAQPAAAIDVKSQLGLARTASYVAQPGHPTLPSSLPVRHTNLAAQGGLKLKR